MPCTIGQFSTEYAVLAGPQSGVEQPGTYPLRNFQKRVWLLGTVSYNHLIPLPKIVLQQAAIICPPKLSAGCGPGQFTQ